MVIIMVIEKILLDGKWKLLNEEKSINISTIVPGSVYEALLENKIIEDPYYGEREHETAWIYNSDWIFETEFKLENTFLNHSKILIRFKGIDTYSDLYLNDKYIGATDDMFLTYEYDVKSLLNSGVNRLKVLIKSPTNMGLEYLKKYRIKLTNFMGLPGIPYLRKPQFSFGWDWGPKLPDISIWQSVELIGYDDIRISSVYPIQRFKYNKDPSEITNPEEFSNTNVESINLKIEVEIETNNLDLKSLGYKINVELISPDEKLISKEEELKEKYQILELKVNNPLLWWTNDLGQQNLYNLKVSIQKEGIIDQSNIKIGIRDIKLIRKPDKWGESFYFLLNGVPVFAKGANWIPVDCFIPRGKKIGLYELNLKYAKEANMNMLRVWGGGLYEDDLFYDLCDELGILVWQDFPFACSLHPIYEKFFELVKNEAIQNIKRLRHRACLALWCGNNEVEIYFIVYAGLARLFSVKKLKAYKSGYRRMFEEMLPDLVKKYDPQHDYWPSSPSNGGGSNKRGLRHSISSNRGDSHFWKVWHLNAPFSAYRKFDSRFMSEYGFESFPAMKTIKNFCPISQFNFNSPIMENHQKNRAGNKKIMKYMKRRFSIPEKFEQQVILSQITHAEAIEYGIEHWRRNRNEFHCMGSLYWQLNDCWPVASWASIDYYGRWKALHYIAKRAYQPLFASVKEERENVEFWVTNDYREIKKGILKWRILNSDGDILLDGSKNLQISPCSSVLVEKVDLREINKKNNYLQNIIFFNLENDKNELIFHGFRLFDDPKNFKIKDPKLSYKLTKLKTEEMDDFTHKIQIFSENIALYVLIESETIDFIASDNYFSMEPGETRDIFLKNIKIERSENLGELIEVKSLFDLL